jgi:hypothetical protein
MFMREANKLNLGSVIIRFKCVLGLHKWRFKYVESKVLHKHSKFKEEHLHNGRICENCKQEQYFWYYITVSGWQNVL